MGPFISPLVAGETSAHNPLISRLHGLFPASLALGSELSSSSTNQSSPPASTHRPPNMQHSLSDPVPVSESPGVNAKVGLSAPELKQRKAIKVLIVTWNMADSLPKGDISVLLGQVPVYEAPERLPESLPGLVEGNAHPYHLVVVAGQECPTPSGVPMGFGGGFMKGIGGREKEREKERERLKLKHPDHLERERDGESESNEQTPVQSPSPAQPQQHSSKGWSDILEEYLCGTTNQHYDIKPSFYHHGQNPAESPHLRAMPSSSAVPTLSLSPRPPSFLRSTSAPSITTPGGSDESSIRIFPQSSFASSPRIQSPLGSSTSLATFSDDLQTPTLMQRDEKPLPPPPPPKQSAEKGAKPYQATPSIILPDQLEREEGSEGSQKRQSGHGPYVFLAKERLLGIYLSVFVYKGCQHLVQGIDKDYVAAGLVGGRVGNKGGIGISVNLAGHRLLFINSHLAAHAARIDARVANIAKIKSEMRLNNFLPLDDPASLAEDLTDQFDTTFWCGDLNFRLDVSRLHADWLVSRKEYNQALEFDQLRRLMSSVESNPFPGFVEAPIDFAPTFKYDVWKSLKHTQRKARRSVRRAQRHNRGVSLSEVHEAQEGRAETEAGPDDDDEAEEEEDGHDRRSFESSFYTSAFQSTRGTDVEDGEESDSHPGTPSQTRPISIAAAAQAAKAKAKLMGLLGRPSPSPSSARHTSMRRRVSKSSPSKFSSSPRDTGSFDMERPHSAASGKISTSPPKAGSRRDISQRLKRTLSGRAMTQAERDESDSSDGDDNMEDNRAGVYDSSKKQRVPSWCDRVLWKTFVEVESTSPTEEEPQDEHKENRLSRIGHAISNVMHGHLRHASRHSLALDREKSLSRDEKHSPSHPDKRSPLGTPPHGISPGLQARSRRGSRSSPTAAPGKGPDASVAPSPTKRNPLIRDSSLGGSPAKPIVIREPAQGNAEMTHTRQRSNSADVFSVAFERPAHPRSSPSHPPPVTALIPSRTFTARDRPVAIQDSPSLSHSITEPPAVPAKEQHLIAARRWFAQLPALLHQRASFGADSPTPMVPEQPKVRRKGEVECIAYGTIDDPMMRRLEGRSDHRPAIFAANVYI